MPVQTLLSLYVQLCSPEKKQQQTSIAIAHKTGNSIKLSLSIRICQCKHTETSQTKAYPAPQHSVGHMVSGGGGTNTAFRSTYAPFPIHIKSVYCTSPQLYIMSTTQHMCHMSHFCDQESPSLGISCTLFPYFVKHRHNLKMFRLDLRGFAEKVRASTGRRD